MDVKDLFPNFPATVGGGTGGGGGSLPYPVVKAKPLAQILSEAVPSALTRAVPNNVLECSLESTGTGWVGGLGNFATAGDRDTAVAGNTATLTANRVYTLIANMTWVWTGSTWAMSDSTLVASGDTAQYLRGDKSWANLTSSVVLEGTNLYFTDARARAAVSGSGALSYNASTGAFTHATTDGYHHIPATGTGSAGKLLIPGATAGSEAWVAMSGDATLAASGALTLASTGVTAGSFGDASSTLTTTVDAKGRVTAVAAVSISIAASQIASGVFAPARLGTGTASTSTWLRGDGTWQVLPAGGLLTVTDDTTSRTANTVYAAPNGSAGSAVFRALVAADIPVLNQNTTGSAGSLAAPRTLTVGLTGKNFDGSAGVTWTLAEIGALAATLKGVANGLAELGADGRVPSSQLPSYVDDVLEYPNLAGFPGTGEAGKIYIAADTNLTYRWSGSAYVEISASLALGETSSTAYRGDRGKIAYDHSQLTGSNPHGVSFAQLASIPASLSAVGALTPTTDSLAYYTSGTAAALTTLSSFARTILDDADASAMLATLGALDSTASRTANTVYAAPNGSAGAPVFRSLVAGDIPGLDASKIISGTLADARIASSSVWNAKLSTVTDDTTSRAANTVLAAPNGSAGTAGFRGLALADLPSINISNLAGITVDTAAPAVAPTTGQTQWFVVEP